MNDEECLINSSNKVINKYTGGINEIDFPQHNPYLIGKFRIKHDFGAMQADGTIYDIKVFGFNDSTFLKFSGFDKNVLEIHFKMPKFSLSGFYKANAKVLDFHINDEGPLTLNFYDFIVKLTFQLERYTRNGKEYFRVTKTDISSDLDTGDFEAPEVSRVIIWSLNKSFNILMKSSMRSYAGDEFGLYYEKTFNSVFTKVPIEDLFLV
ncbi:hypothetical protein ACKWTF_013236 [Chironomus riparius]